MGDQVPVRSFMTNRGPNAPSEKIFFRFSRCIDSLISCAMGGDRCNQLQYLNAMVRFDSVLWNGVVSFRFADVAS